MVCKGLEDLERGADRHPVQLLFADGMERVESYLQFGEQVREFKRKQKDVRFNCFFLPGEVRAMTAKGSLYMKKERGSLCFFVREARCWRLYYYRAKGTVPKIERQERPVLLDFVFREDAMEEEELQAWEGRGFQRYKRYRRMECAAADFIPPYDQGRLLARYPVQRLLPGDYNDCIALWKSSLDDFSTVLPDRMEFADACENGEIIGMRLEDGSVGAVNRGIFKGKTAFMQHLSVSPRLRGRGMGRTLCCASIGAMFTDYGAEKVNFWVDEKNVHAIEIYRRMGFVNDGIVSVQMRLEQEEKGGTENGS